MPVTSYLGCLVFEYLGCLIPRVRNIYSKVFGIVFVNKYRRDLNEGAGRHWHHRATPGLSPRARRDLRVVSASTARAPSRAESELRSAGGPYREVLLCDRREEARPVAERNPVPGPHPVPGSGEEPRYRRQSHQKDLCTPGRARVKQGLRERVES